MAQSISEIPPTIGLIPFKGAFPDEPVEFAHELHLDDRLSLEAIAELADRLPRQSVVCDVAGQSLLAPHGGPPRGVLDQPGDVIRNLKTADSWITLLNANDDPDFAELMNTVLNELEPGMRAKQGPMRKRVAFVIVSSPNSVTPVHFDIEYSLLMQVRGSRTLSIGRYASDAIRRHEVDRYWDGSHGRIEELPEEVVTFTLRPGRAVYIPAGTPHWVHNGPDISQSVTFTYFTSATVRENRVEDLNSRLRRLHLSPREPGRSFIVDTAKVGAIGLWAAGRRVQSKVVGSLRRRNDLADRTSDP
jgi:hypothetical protein